MKKRKTINRQALLSFIGTQGVVTTDMVAKQFDVDSLYAGVSLQDACKPKSAKIEKIPDPSGSRKKLYRIKGTSVEHVAEAPTKAPETPAAVVPKQVSSPPKAPSLNISEVIQSAVNQIADAVAREVDARLEETISEYLKQAFEKIPTRVQEAIRSETLIKEGDKVVRLKKVLVVGLLNSQAGMISNEFCEKLSLTFITSDERNATVGDRARGTDHILVMTGFINHALVDKIRSSTEVQIQWVNGGMTSLRQKLTELST